jgi:hypothetical protein
MNSAASGNVRPVGGFRGSESGLGEAAEGRARAMSTVAAAARGTAFTAAGSGPVIP